MLPTIVLWGLTSSASARTLPSMLPASSIASRISCPPRRGRQEFGRDVGVDAGALEALEQLRRRFVGRIVDRAVRGEVDVLGARDALHPEGAVKGAGAEDWHIDPGRADLLDRGSAAGWGGAHDYCIGVGASQLADLAGDCLVADLEVGRAGDRAAEML